MYLDLSNDKSTIKISNKPAINSPVNPVFDRYFVFGESSTLEELVDAMDRKEAGDVGVQVDSDRYFYSVRSHNLK